MQDNRGDYQNMPYGQGVEPPTEYNYFAQSMLGKDNESFLKWQFDIEDIVSQMCHLLRGEIFDETNNTWKSSNFQLMNEQGITRLMAIFRSHIGKLYLLGNLNEESINQIMFDYCASIIEDLFYHYEMYGINPKNFEAVKTMLESQAITCLRSGLDATRATLLVSTYKTNEYIERQKQQEQKRGLFGLLGWGKNSN